MARILVLLVSLPLSFACVSPGTLGVTCDADADCAEGFECLPLAQFASADDCAEVGKQCTKSCEVDADCEELEAGAKCFAGCEAGTLTCGATG